MEGNESGSYLGYYAPQNITVHYWPNQNEWYLNYSKCILWYAYYNREVLFYIANNPDRFCLFCVPLIRLK